VKIEDGHILNYQLATPDDPVVFTLMKVWVKIDDGEPIQLVAKRNETIEEFIIRHKIAKSML